VALFGDLVLLPAILTTRLGDIFSTRSTPPKGLIRSSE